MFYSIAKYNEYWNAYNLKTSRSVFSFLSRRKGPWLLVFILWGCTAQQLRNKNLTEENNFNSLIQEKSSFLRQYAHNPVNWNPWSEETLNEAKKQNKIIFLSIGYSSSHASHRMEKETFRDSNFVAYLNEHTIPILVDREERPDIAEYYQIFCDYFNEQACTFPLNIILLPDTKPLFSASVLRTALWKDLLLRYIRLYNQVPDEAHELAQRLDDQMKDKLRPQIQKNFRLKTALSQEIYFQRLRRKLQIGNPNPVEVQANLPTESLAFFETVAADGQAQAKNLWERQLNRMAMGGTYDHLGGGFFLRSKDSKSRYPDFEKLLVDNAQKIDLFAGAYHITRKPAYEQVLYESIESMERDFRKESGAYLSSWDADSEGEEGNYYLWSHIEIDAELGAKSELFKRTYNISREGNWDDRQNVLYRELTDADLAYAYRIRPPQFQGELDILRRSMLQARDKRVKPDRDPHQITSWNARLIQAYIRAYRSTQDQNLRVRAQRLMGILEDQHLDQFPRINHIQGQEHEIEFLEDYAHLIQAYIDLHQVSLDERYIEKAQELIAYTLSRFYDARTGLFYFSFGGEGFEKAPFISLQDGIIENANAVMCEALFKMGRLLGRNTYTRTAEYMFQTVGPLIEEYPEKYVSWSAPLLHLKHGLRLLIVSSGDKEALTRKVDRLYYPDLVFSSNFPYADSRGDSPQGKKPYHLCRFGDCGEGFSTAEEVWANLDQ